MLCSSLGRHQPPLELGPVDYVSSRGAAIRIAVELSLTPGLQFVVAERNGYAAIIHRELPIDVFVDRQDVSLGLFARSSSRLLVHRGTFDPEWVHQNLENKQFTAYFDGHHVVALVQSERFDYVSYTAMPAAYLDRQVRTFAQVLVPIGLLVGLLLAWALLLLARQQMTLWSSMRQGLKRNEFFMAYQPIVDLQSGRWVGAEALLRWRRPDGNLMEPGLFIPVAEEHNLIRLITERVMELVAHDVTDLMRRYPEFRIGFNLSSADLQSPDIVPALREFLRITRARPANIVIEATERGFLASEAGRQIVHDIRVMGIQVAIDDFGTGYSSLSYLTTLELDYLKIDKSFVEAVDTDAATNHVALHIIDMAKSLNLAITAEGVETVSQAEFLRRHGVQFAQGWLFGKPMAIEELERHLEQSPPSQKNS